LDFHKKAGNLQNCTIKRQYYLDLIELLLYPLDEELFILHGSVSPANLLSIDRIKILFKGTIQRDGSGRKVVIKERGAAVFRKIRPSPIL
jgi:hypothetical protein